MTFDYDIFFSYRHKPLDAEMTQKIFNLAENYRLPAAVAGDHSGRITRAFRDTEELPVSRILTETIDRALHSSNCLVVVCSRDTPSSEWVDREVETFIRLGRSDHIYPLLITGDPDVSFPPSLKLVPDIHDRVIDARSEDISIKKMMGKARTGILRVIADVTGCREADLLREDKLRRSRAFAVKAAGAAAFFGFTAAVSLGLMRQAQEYRDEANRRERASMEMIRELTYDLPDHLVNIPGAYSKISDILQENTRDLNQIILLSKDKETAQYETAVNYEKLANATSALGSYDDALEAEREAISLFTELTSSGVPGTGKSLASAYNNRGNILHAAGRYQEAAADYEEAIQKMDLQGSADENNASDEENLLLRVRMLYNSGANALSAGNDSGAEEYFKMALESIRGLEKSAVYQTDVLEAGAQICYNYAVLLYRSGRFPETEEKLKESLERYDRLMEQTGGLQVRSDRMRAQALMASCLTDQGKYTEAEPWYEEAAAEAEALAKDTDRVDYISMLAQLYNNRGLGFNIQGNYAEADRYYSMAAEWYGEIAERTNTDSDRAVYAVSLLNTGENAFKMQDYERSRQKFEEGLRLYEPLCRELGDYDTAQYYAWLSYYELIHRRDFAAALDAAMEAYSLQPGNVLVNLNLAYAALYSGYYEDCDEIFSAVASLGEGQMETIRGDLQAQRKAGMSDAHHEEVLGIIDGRR